MSNHKTDSYAYAAGQTARRTGFLHNVYRSAGTTNPLDKANNFIRLCVAFIPTLTVVGEEPKIKYPYRAAWSDWTYLKEGDFLAGPEGILFVSQINPPQPMLVVTTNTTICLFNENKELLFIDIPANLVLDSISELNVLTNKKPLTFTAIFPNVTNGEPRPGDIIQTREGDRYLIDRAELTGITWKLSLLLEP